MLRQMLSRHAAAIRACLIARRLRAWLYAMMLDVSRMLLTFRAAMLMLMLLDAREARARR